MKRCLLIGSTGYLGSELIQALKFREYSFTTLAFKELKSWALENNKNIEKSILDKIESCDVIVYLACQTSIRIAENNPIEDFDNNILPLGKLLALLKLKNKKVDFIFLSTVTVYGLTPPVKINEEYPLHPLTIYEVNKAISESMIYSYSKCGAIDGLTLRLANVYGPSSKTTVSDRGLINLLISKIIKGEDVILLGDGQFLRDYIYIDDVINGIISAINMPKKNGEAFNLATGNSHSIKEVVEMILSKVKALNSTKSNITYSPFPTDSYEIEKRNFMADIEKFSNAAKWNAKVNLNEGITQTIKHYVSKQ